uniref:Uncharacterized protein n=1 Tax=Cacopsylla melanoneura TaxID=428564 RepID=A0A8D9BDE6_9HEMI
MKLSNILPHDTVSLHRLHFFLKDNASYVSVVSSLVLSFLLIISFIFQLCFPLYLHFSLFIFSSNHFIYLSTLFLSILSSNHFIYVNFFFSLNLCAIYMEIVLRSVAYDQAILT